MQIALWEVDDSDGGIVGPETANFTATLCPDVEGIIVGHQGLFSTGEHTLYAGDYVTIGLPASFQALGYKATTYGLTWTFETGAYTMGPLSSLPPAPGLTHAVNMLLNGVPAAPHNWQPIQVWNSTFEYNY
jgi:hypothetical protein